MQNNMNSIGHTSANLNNSITSLGNNTSNAVGNMQNNLNRLNQTNNNIATQTARNTRNMQDSFNKLSQASSSIAGLGIGAGITALGAESIQTVSKFDDIMARVKATTGATTEEFEKLRKQAIDLGATTAWSASQSAEGMTYLAMAGWDVNQIYDAMPGMLALASAGALDLGRAADIASDVMTAMGMEAEEAGHMADVLAKAATSSNTSVELLGETMKYAAPVAHTFGASLEDTTAIAAKMADAGIKGSMSGTALRMGMNRLAAPTKNAKKWLDDLGVATTDASGNMRDITDIIRDLEKGMDKLSNSERIQAASKIFGVEAMSAWLAAIDAGSDSIEELSDKLVNSNGYALETAAIMEDTLGGAFRALSGAWESLMISFGDEMKPVVIKIAEWLQMI
ncbi:phage tail tape measure protein, partial [Butyricicoccus sp. 1XD8-22]